MAKRPIRTLPFRPGRSVSKSSINSTAMIRIREFLRNRTLRVRNRMLPRAVAMVTMLKTVQAPETTAASVEEGSTECAGIQAANSFNSRYSPTERAAKEGISP